MVKWNDDVMKEISIMNSILPSLGKDVSIDIGTSMTRVMGGTRETMMSEPSIVATDTKLVSTLCYRSICNGTLAP